MNIRNSAQNNAVALRARLRQARADLPAAQRDRGGLLMRGRLFTWLNAARDQAVKRGARPPATVAAFWPLEHEPDLRPLLDQWAQAGIAVALPAIREPAAPLEFRAWTPGAALRAGPYNVQEPAADSPLLRPDVVLVPTLGYTLQADRLGYGGGYYDRTLAALQRDGQPCTTIGVAWNEGLIDSDDYQPAEHDVRLDAVLTPDGWVPEPPLLGPGAPTGGSLGSYVLR
ncbi:MULTISPECIES: 5-formyltetrahydrofolate cyclo-ligase [Bordetella]|uniref:5-formyltetrahydrofolate cyclo-ligase n=2 Tax=Bordetella TaxID=517 RepID=A0A261V623_9BORD|nr:MULTISPECIES: 5-formyltetrahydrofolate cyclo-ligase [Bordetella]MDM9558881.1 5-formyltetrahydrofolate cyclo-ligase [Bordetella petrii]OZI69614.1 5-formyltetrahydrofolate cyclo-ligase [Bordetella genomosp. 2]